MLHHRRASVARTKVAGKGHRSVFIHWTRTSNWLRFFSFTLHGTVSFLFAPLKTVSCGLESKLEILDRIFFFFTLEGVFLPGAGLSKSFTSGKFSHSAKRTPDLSAPNTIENVIRI